MTTELVLKEDMMPMMVDQSLMDSAMDGIDSADLMIPKILLTQALSKAVKGAGAKAGDILDSVELTKLGDEESPVEFLPISSYKTWTVMQKTAKPPGYKGEMKFEFKQIIPVTPDNATRDPFLVETKEDGSQERWDITLNFYILLTSMLAKGIKMPYLLSCRMTSYPAGRKIVNHFHNMKLVGGMPFSKTIRLKSKFTEKNGNQYYVFDMDSQGRLATKEEFQLSLDWLKQIKNKTVNIQVDNSDLTDSSSEQNSDDEVAPF